MEPWETLFIQHGARSGLLPAGYDWSWYRLPAIYEPFKGTARAWWKESQTSLIGVWFSRDGVNAMYWRALRAEGRRSLSDPKEPLWALHEFELHRDDIVPLLRAYTKPNPKLRNPSGPQTAALVRELFQHYLAYMQWEPDDLMPESEVPFYVKDVLARIQG
jgi:hypothetical protein